MAQAFASTIVADKTGERGDIFLGSIDLKIEIGLNFKGLPKIGINRGQSSIQGRVADHDNFGVGRNRFGSEALRRDEAEKHARLLDSQFAVLDYPLQRLPDSHV